MFILGVFFDFFQALCFSKTSGVLWMALGMVLLPQLLAIESQMAQYLGEHGAAGSLYAFSYAACFSI
jgi:hypothetical protein